MVLLIDGLTKPQLSNVQALARTSADKEGLNPINRFVSGTQPGRIRCQSSEPRKDATKSRPTTLSLRQLVSPV